MRLSPSLPILLGLTLALVSCQEAIVMPPEEEAGSIEMVFDMSAAAAAGFVVSEAVATFDRADGGDPVVVTTAVTDGTAVMDVVLRPGRWDIGVELFNAGEVVGSGEGSALVRAGFVTEVDIEIELGTGGVRLNVRWAEDFTGVIADLSGRPAAAEVHGIGLFKVHGLSRVGWDIEVIETPTGVGRTHKDPGAISYPDIVMLGLTSTLEQVEALAAWIGGPHDPRVVTIHLMGLGGEDAVVAVYDVVPVDANTTIVPAGVEEFYTLSGVRLSVSTDRLEIVESASFMELVEYTAVDHYPACAAPGQAVEIEGVSSAAPLWPCYPEGTLAVPAAGSSDPLYLPGLRDGLATYTWAFDIRMDAQTLGCAGCGTVSRKAMSVISLAGEELATETGRVNLFEVWPSSFTFFDPEVEYGHSYLFATNIVTDLVEDG